MNTTDSPTCKFSTWMSISKNITYLFVIYNMKLFLTGTISLIFVLKCDKTKTFKQILMHLLVFFHLTLLTCGADRCVIQHSLPA